MQKQKNMPIYIYIFKGNTYDPCTICIYLWHTCIHCIYLYLWPTYLWPKYLHAYTCIYLWPTCIYLWPTCISYTYGLPTYGLYTFYLHADTYGLTTYVWSLMACILLAYTHMVYIYTPATSVFLSLTAAAFSCCPLNLSVWPNE